MSITKTAIFGFIACLYLVEVSTRILLPQPLIKGTYCISGRRHLEECNVCTCIQGNMIDCTHFNCDPSNGYGNNVTCVENEVKVQGCNLCHCWTNEWNCNERLCQNPGDKPGKQLGGRIVRDSVCIDKDTREDDCNKCTCINERWSCTEKLCTKREPRGIYLEEDLRDVPCAPNDYFEVQCNTCRCKDEGVGYTCTDQYCDQEQDLTAINLYNQWRKAYHATTPVPPKIENEVRINKTVQASP